MFGGYAQLVILGHRLLPHVIVTKITGVHHANPLDTLDRKLLG